MSSSKFVRKMKSLVKVSSLGAAIAGGLLYYRNDEKFFSEIAMPLGRFIFPPETGHKFDIFLLKWNLIPKNNYKDPDTLRTTICGINLKNPVGLAAGYDKNGEILKSLHSLGFGFVEMGSVTPDEEEGNEKPRQFDLNEDEAIIHRYGHRSRGHEFTVPKMRALRRREEYNEIIGINIDKNKNHDLVKDISYGVKVFSPVANYLAVNVERNLSKEVLRELLIEINEARKLFDIERQRPVFLKLSPDLNSNELRDIVKIVNEKKCKIHGFIISNGTSDRNLNLKSKYQTEEGVLSGKPLRDKSTKMIEEVYRLTKGKIAIIGVGGISCGKDAFEKILAGASAVQIYTSFVYHGPPVITKIKRELNELLVSNGYENVGAAVGKGVKIEKGWFSLFK